MTSIPKVPDDDPKKYCRLCFSTIGVQVFKTYQRSNELNIIDLLKKYINICLLKQDFPCGVCGVCLEKLVELHTCNEDGQVEEWEDEDILTFKRTCEANHLIIKEARLYTAPVKARKRQIPATNEKSESTGSKQTNLNHGNALTFKCPACPERFTDIDELIKHRAFHVGNALHKKKQNKNSAPVRNEYVYNLKTLFVNNIFTCPDCFQQFPTRRACLIHLNTAHNVFVCFFCPKAFQNLTVLAKHQTGHRKAADYIFYCDYCLDQYEIKENLQQHIVNAHTILVDNSNEDSSFNNYYNSNSDIQMEFTCGDCFALFRTEQELLNHIGKCSSQAQSSIVVEISDED